MTSTLRPTRFEIDLDAVRHNVRMLSASAGTAELCAVVKADGYGHGATTIARTALDEGVTWLAVATVDEGEQLRATLSAPILLLSEPTPDAVPRLIRARLTPTIYSREMADALAADGRRLDVHLKVDTGMGRLGAPPETWEGLLDHVRGTGRLRVTGIWTHLARADEPDVTTTDEQLDRFEAAVAIARDKGVDPPLLHAANSAATLLHPRARYSMVRIGIALYGLSPSVAVDARDHDLRPVGSLRTSVGHVKSVEAGQPVSYGHRWRAPAGGWIATLPVGYADGVPRLLTNNAVVLHNGRPRPVVGTVTMDYILVWFDDEAPARGDEIVLIGRQGPQEVRVEDWAERAGTITYEIATSIAARVPRTP
ncbi:MAG: alanine racemase [Nitriliruptorales bacterium]|nr:alanine racemase [Nitriliruptorales bacterium]